MVTSFKHYNDVRDRRVAVFYLSHGPVWVYEIEMCHMGKNNGNPNLVCENVFDRHKCQLVLFAGHRLTMWTYPWYLGSNSQK